VHSSDLSLGSLLRDRLEIHDLVNRYAYGVDRRDFELVASCFTPDVEVIGWGGRDFADRDDLIEFISGVAAFDMTMHMMGNQRIEVHADEAWVVTRAMLAHRLRRPDSSMYELNVADARYTERLARREGRWVITQRGGDDPAPSDQLARGSTSDPVLRWLLDRAVEDEARAAGTPFVGITLGTAPPPEGREASPSVRHLVDRATIQNAVVRATSPETATLLNNHAAVIEGDEATAETYAYIGEPWHEGAVRFVDRLVRQGDAWRVVERRATDNWLR